MSKTEDLNVLVIGSGGREHALCWAIAKSPRLGSLWCAPGNDGIAQVAQLSNVAIDDFDAVASFCDANQIGLVVVGPEAPLVAGICDHLTERGIKVFGPSKAAAQLEASKAFTKKLCDEAGIPTAAYAHFDNIRDAQTHLNDHPLPVVIKADGLASGKGVVIAATLDAARAAVDACFSGAFGNAGAEVVIEEFLDGEEASFFAIVDGETVLPLATAQDHKRVGDGDTGPNTGGMGAYSPAPVMTPAMVEATMEQIVRPTVRAMAARGTPYRGVLYAGLMITREGPKLIEYNVRFGDPECQALIVRLESDVLEVLLAASEGCLDRVEIKWSAEPALTIVMAAKGYPGTPEKGSVIGGLGALTADADASGVTVFHAGTKRAGDEWLANGGRVLAITARGETVRTARDKAYAAVDRLDWPGGFCRRDIAWRALERD